MPCATMASDALRRGAPFRVSVILIAAALVRLGASAPDAERTTSSPDPDWHVVSVASLLPAAACTSAKGTYVLLRACDGFVRTYTFYVHAFTR